MVWIGQISFDSLAQRNGNCLDMSGRVEFTKPAIWPIRVVAAVVAEEVVMAVAVEDDTLPRHVDITRATITGVVMKRSHPKLQILPQAWRLIIIQKVARQAPDIWMRETGQGHCIRTSLELRAKCQMHAEEATNLKQDHEPNVEVQCELDTQGRHRICARKNFRVISITDGQSSCSNI
eukprot:scaffold319684_cov152-Cyclotella_meneghiniana.AAC.1